MTFEPHKISEETYLTYTHAAESFRQLGRHVWCLPALAIMIDQNVCFSDHIDHCVYNIDLLDQVTSLYLRQEGEEAVQNDGPRQRLDCTVQLD